MDRARILPVEPSKNKSGYRPTTYDLQERVWKNTKGTYSSFREAKLRSWRCEKCGGLFSTSKHLKTHKVEDHSY